MKIWLINHYAVPPQYYPLARPSLFAKNLIKMGHDVTIIAASTVHNTNCENLIEGSEKVARFVDDGIPYVLINCCPYRGNGIKRIINILQFARRLPGVLDTLGKPDAIVATSFDPFTCYAGIKYAKKHGIKAVAEIADLWPETLLSYTNISKHNPIVLFLRKMEKSIYCSADAVVFTMEGAYDYIVEQGWTSVVPRSKVHYINNGIDLELFDYNKAAYKITDSDLLDERYFKVIYSGSIRKANHLSSLLDAAKLISNTKIRLLIWGNGDDVELIKHRIDTEKISNVKYKGTVKKKYIPYITSCADLNIIHGQGSPVLRFGLSLNKMFDYLASGKAILIDFHSPYNPAMECGACIGSVDNSPFEIARAIEAASELSNDQRYELGKNARIGAEKYDFKVLTQQLIRVIDNI